MHVSMLLFAAAILGIEVGWQPAPEGGVEYIIQLDLQTLQLLQAGEAIQSHIPAAAGEVRSYRIVVGEGPLPRRSPPTPESPPESGNTVDQQPPKTLPTDHSGGKPLAGSPAVFIEQEDTPAAETTPPQEAKPWLPLVFTLLGLFTSLGANVYLAWIAWDARRLLCLRHDG